MRRNLMTAWIATMLLSAPLATTPLVMAQDGPESVSGMDVKKMVKATPTLQETLDATKAKSAAKFPPELLQKFANGIQAVRDNGVEASAKNVGDTAPDATLSNFNGQSVQLSSLWQKGPIVLMWYRGGW